MAINRVFLMNEDSKQCARKLFEALVTASGGNPAVDGALRLDGLGAQFERELAELFQLEGTGSLTRQQLHDALENMADAYFHRDFKIKMLANVYFRRSHPAANVYFRSRC